MKKYIFLFLALWSTSLSAQDCDELMKRNPSMIFPTSYAAEFGGVDEVINCGDQSDFSFTDGSGNDQPFTVLIWMNRANSTNNHVLISKYPNEYLLALVGTTLRIQILNSAGNAYIGRTAPLSTTGSWIGVAMTYTGNENSTGIKLYSVTTTGVVTQIDNADLNHSQYTGMSNTATTFRIGSAHQAIWFFEGKLASPLVANRVLTTTELAELSKVQNWDYRKVDFYDSAIISAWYFPNGQNDYPTYVDYKSGHDGTMLNMEATDISSETP